MSISNIGQVTGNSALLYVASIYTGLDVALNNPAAKPAWHGGEGGRPICTYQNVAQQLAEHQGQMGKVIPKTAVFPFSPPTAAMDLLTGGRTMQPLVRESLTVQINRYGCGYFISRQDFYADVWGTIRRVPEKLARPATKIGDVLLAAVLRTGKTVADWTGTNFFSTGKPVAPSGALAATNTFDNLYTTTPLTPAGLQKIYKGMSSIKNEDGLSMNISPDSLIVPSEMWPEAIQATEITYPVYSQTANPFNTGQASATAAMGENWIATKKLIKQIVKLPELTQGNASIDKTSYYMAECLNQEHGGAPGLVFAEDPAVEFFILMDTNDVSVWTDDSFSWAVQKWAGAGPGLAQFIARADA